MTDISNFAHPEQANGAGDVYANGLTIFGQEVLADFLTRNVMQPLIRSSTIVDSKTKQFDRVGNIVSDYHDVGTEVLGDEIIANKINISVDDRPLLGSVFMDQAEKILSHYDARAEYVVEISRSISDKLDARIQQVLVNASKASAPVTGGPTGGTAAVANSDTDGAVLVAEIFTARASFMAKNVPVSNLMCAVNPVVFHILAQENAVIHSDLNVGDNGGNNVVHDTIMIAGISVIATNNLPSTIVAADAHDGNTYAGTFTNLTAIIWNKGAAMTVVAKPLTMESDGYRSHYQGTTIVGKTLQGTGVFRNEEAYSIFST